jgi:hypothetical protein
MEFRQAVQNRATRTAAVIRQFLPTPSLGSVTVDGLLGQSQTPDELTQRRDDALADFDAADNAENQCFAAIRALTLPQAAQANSRTASTLLDLLSPVQADAASTRLGMVLRRWTAFLLVRGSLSRGSRGFLRRRGRRAAASE